MCRGEDEAQKGSVGTQPCGPGFCELSHVSRLLPAAASLLQSEFPTPIHLSGVGRFLSKCSKSKSHVLQSNTTDHRQVGVLCCQEQWYNNPGLLQVQAKPISQWEEHTIHVLNCPWLHRTVVTMPGSRPSSPCFFKDASATSLLPPSSAVEIASAPSWGQWQPGEVQQPFARGLRRHCTSCTSI